MMIIISPAKKLEIESAHPECPYTIPTLLDHSDKLIKSLRRYSSEGLSEIMNLSPSLAELNCKRYKDWSLPFDDKNARQALFAFKGDVYVGMEPQQFNSRDLRFAQLHLRVLSGLYGVLQPLDLMQPYRLEMGTTLKVGKKKNLYEFWGDTITNTLNEAMTDVESDVLINLASNEYFKSVKPKLLNAPVVTPVFKEEKAGKLRMLGMFAKKARGMMAAYIIKNKLRDAGGLKDFSEAGYSFARDLSDEKQLVFTRPQPAPVR